MEDQKEVGAYDTHRGFIFSVAFSPDSRVLASASSDQNIRLWDLTHSRELGALRGHLLEVTRVAFFPDGKTLASGCKDGSVKVWSMTPKVRPERLVILPTSVDVRSHYFVQNARGAVTIWNLETGQKETERRVGGALVRAVVAISPDGQLMAAGTESGTARLWRTGSWQEVAPPLRGHLQGIHSIAFSPDGRRLVTGGTSGNEAVRLWDVVTHQELATLQGSGSGFVRIAFSPDGNTILAVNYGGQIHLWRAPDLASIEASGRNARWLD